jgi:hypothetical protein
MEEVKKYDCVCPSCGHEFKAALSMFQKMGNFEMGHGSCAKCNLFLNLTFDETNQVMICTPWDEFVKKIDKTKNQGE